MTERFFIDKPTATGEKDAEGFHLYRESDGSLLKWSGGRMATIPEVNQKIWITMNGIGPAIVQGYFASDGFLGVMTKALNPPAWLKLQNEKGSKDMTKPLWYRMGIGCEFGTEIALSAPRKRSEVA